MPRDPTLADFHLVMNEVSVPELPAGEQNPLPSDGPGNAINLDQVIRRWRAGESVAQIAGSLNVGRDILYHQVRRVLTADQRSAYAAESKTRRTPPSRPPHEPKGVPPDPALLNVTVRPLSGRGSQKWDTGQIIEALQEAAGDSSVLTTNMYIAWRKHHPGPSTRTICLRLGNWSAAVVTAGLLPGVKNRKGRTSVYFTDEDIWSAAEDFLAWCTQTGRPTNINRYWDDWMATESGRRPGRATVIGRLPIQWSEFLEQHRPPPLNHDHRTVPDPPPEAQPIIEHATELRTQAAAHFAAASEALRKAERLETLAAQVTAAITGTEAAQAEPPKRGRGRPRSRHTQALIDVAVAAGRPVTTKEIAQALGRTTEQVRTTFRFLTNVGIAQKTGRSEYLIVADRPPSGDQER